MLSEVAPVHKEVISGTETTISCTITGLKVGADASIEWQTSTGAAVAGSDFTSAPGSNSAGTQEATLVVKTAAVDADKVYSCQVTSGTYTASDASKTAVNLDVYG